MVLAAQDLYNTRLIFPFFKQLIPDLGWLYVPFAVFVLVAWSNAVNLTDGLDGLAISTFAVSAATLTALAYVTGHRVFAEYLLLVRFAPAAELTGVLRRAGRRQPRVPLVQRAPGRDLHGRRRLARPRRRARHGGHPDQAGDPARAGRRRLRARSGRRSSFRSRRSSSPGKRVFKMAPLHHHFELIGWQEPKVIARFLIVSIIFALFSLTSLKLR